MDKLTPEQRRRCMQANKSKGTKPEVLLGKALWQLGLRYRKNSTTVFGKPDFSFKKYKVAVFLDGEFWHGKDWDKKKNNIKNNREFWIAKIERNMNRDKEVNERLHANGWIVCRFWGNDIARNPAWFAEEIRKVIYEKHKSLN